MHALYYTPHVGRFVSVDKIPVLDRAMVMPKAWNLYSYAASSPLKYIEPSGDTFVLTADLRHHRGRRVHRDVGAGGDLRRRGACSIENQAIYRVPLLDQGKDSG